MKIIAKTLRPWLPLAPIIIGLLLVTTVAQAEVKTLINPVVVRVNGQDVSETEFLYFLMGKYGDDIVDQLVENLALAQEADQFGLQINVQDGWDFLNNNYSKDKLAALKSAFDLDIVAESLAREVLARQVINKKSEQLIDELGIEITDEEILQFYLDNIDNLVVPESAKFAWIVTDDQATADKALARLDKGDAFSDVAKELSVDEMTKDDGGDVGVIVKGETKGLPQEIEDKIFSLSAGEYSKVVPYGDNFFIILTQELRDSYEPSLEELKPLIKTKLVTQKLDAPLSKWLKGLSDKAQIEIVYPIFQEMESSGGMVPESN